jgi:hypothetical protein
MSLIENVAICHEDQEKSSYTCDEVHRNSNFFEMCLMENVPILMRLAEVLKGRSNLE